MTLTRIGLGSKPVPLPVRPPRSGFPPDTLFPFFSLTLAILAAPRQLHVDMEQVPIVHPIPALPVDRVHARCQTRQSGPMGPLRLGRIRGDRIADMDMYARLRRGGDLQRHRRSGRVPPRVVNPSWIAR